MNAYHVRQFCVTVGVDRVLLQQQWSVYCTSNSGPCIAPAAVVRVLLQQQWSVYCSSSSGPCIVPAAVVRVLFQQLICPVNFLSSILITNY